VKQGAPDPGYFEPFAAMSHAVHQSFVTANERFDAREQGLAYHGDAEGRVFRHLMGGWPVHIAIRRALIDAEGDPAMQRAILGLVGERMRMLWDDARDRLRRGLRLG
jgi:hypothetical protein